MKFINNFYNCFLARTAKVSKLFIFTPVNPAIFLANIYNLHAIVKKVDNIGLFANQIKLLPLESGKSFVCQAYLDYALKPALVLRVAATPMPSKPIPNNAKEAGSGMADTNVTLALVVMLPCNE